MYRKSPRSLFKHLDFVLLDLLILEFALCFSFYLRHHTWDLSLIPTYRSVMFILAAVHICTAVYGNGYKSILRRSKAAEAASVLRHVLAVFTLLLVCLFFLKTDVLLSRVVAVYLTILSFAGLWTERMLWKAVLRRHFRRRRRIMLLVSDETGAERLLNHFSQRIVDFDIRGIVLLSRQGADSRKTQICQIPVISDADGLIPWLESNAADEILFSIPEMTVFPAELIRKCRKMGITTHLELEGFDEISGARIVERLSGITVLTSYTKLVTLGDLFLKRALDIAGGLAGLFLTGLITLFLAPAIYLSDPGPVFFSQQRVGRNGRTFRIYKFRSMYQDAEARKKELMEKNEMQGFMFKLDADPRIIGSGPDGTEKGLGHFIRTTSLDEFPQFWNVLKGDMSLVGTRPPTIDEWQQYDLHHRARLAVKPGITGMWQVSGRSDITDFEEIVRLDTEYIQNWSLRLDLMILIKTVGVVFLRKGSK